jgi:hypothetical protein
MRVVRENCIKDATTWGQVDFILGALGPEGMSGDESDWSGCKGRPQGFRTKTLKHMELPWRNPAIAELLSSVDTYEGVVREECFINPRGNRPLNRCDVVIARKTKPVRGLPRNLYKDEWFRGLTLAAKECMDCRKNIPIPHLVR